MPNRSEATWDSSSVGWYKTMEQKIDSFSREPRFFLLSNHTGCFDRDPYNGFITIPTYPGSIMPCTPSTTRVFFIADLI